MFERFTDRARKAIALANQEAQRFRHEYIGTEHILLGIIKEGSGVGAHVLEGLNVDLRKIRLQVERIVKSGSTTSTMDKLPRSKAAKQVFTDAIAEAASLRHNYIGTEHILLALVKNQETLAFALLDNCLNTSNDKTVYDIIKDRVLMTLKGSTSGSDAQIFINNILTSLKDNTSADQGSQISKDDNVINNFKSYLEEQLLAAKRLKESEGSLMYKPGYVAALTDVLNRLNGTLDDMA